MHRADSLDQVVKGLDNYKSLADVAVTFGFDKANLTKDDKDQLDQFAGQLNGPRKLHPGNDGWNGLDGLGRIQLRAEQSPRRRSGAVPGVEVQRLPAHRFYLIGIGKDKEVAPNNTAEGRKQNRRVEIRLLTNMGGDNGTQAKSTTPTGN